MRREQKILVTVVWGFAVMTMLGWVALGFRTRETSEAPRILFDAPQFSLTDQTGQTISDKTLRGNVWVAFLFFTQCPGVCPMMSGRMADLQKSVPQKDVQIVAFSLDPEHDTPEIMKAYADRFGADSSRWHMLTGEKQTMYSLALGLELPAAPAHDGQPIAHSQRLLLIDRDNHVRNFYDSNDDDSMKQLAADARKLADE